MGPDNKRKKWKVRRGASQIKFFDRRKNAFIIENVSSSCVVVVIVYGQSYEDEVYITLKRRPGTSVHKVIQTVRRFASIRSTYPALDSARDSIQVHSLTEL